jgi:hypothetical protein
MKVSTPHFNSQQNLMQGIHPMSWDEFKNFYGTTFWRRKLIQGLRSALFSLKKAGCSKVYIDGSFVTQKKTPGDFDACWDASGVNISLLKKIDPVLLDFKDKRAAQKAKFKGELFPAQAFADEFGTIFLDFFQKDKHTGEPKGIISIDLGGLK